MRMITRARARLHDESGEGGERGAVAVIVAVCLVMLFGMAAFAIDTGNLWQNRRHLRSIDHGEDIQEIVC